MFFCKQLPGLAGFLGFPISKKTITPCFFWHEKTTTKYNTEQITPSNSSPQNLRLDWLKAKKAHVNLKNLISIDVQSTTRID